MSEPDFAAVNELTRMLRERKDALTIRWLVVTLSIGVFGLVLAALAKSPPDPFPAAFEIAAWLAAAALALLSILLPRKQLTDRQILRQLALPVDPQRWASQMRLRPDQTRSLTELPDLEQRLFGLTMLFERPYTLALALTGGVAIVALIYGVAARTMVGAMPLLLAALALNGWHFPRLTKLIERGRKLDSRAEEARTVRELTKMRRETARKAQSSDRPPGSPARPAPSRKP